MVVDSSSFREFAGGRLDTFDIPDGAVTEAKLADDSVATASIVDDAVSNAKLAPSALKSYKFTYDFAVQGGSTGAKTLTAANGQLPDNFCITTAYVECVTPATSSGAATIALGTTDTAEAFIAATAYTDNKFDTADNFAALTAAIPVKCDGANDVIATIADAALTAGKVVVWVLGFEGA